MTLYRSVLPVLLICFYGGLFLVRALGFHETYDNILYGLGIVPFDWPFVDSHGILSAAQCHREGADISAGDPCDVLNRPFNYSPFWLDLVPRFATTEYTRILGTGFNLAFAAAVYAVLRPSSWWQVACLAVACTSTAVTFAVERGNADLFMFALAALAVLLCGRGQTARLAAYATCFLAGLLKFYPFVLLTMALQEPPRRFVRIAVTSTAALVVFVLYYRDAILKSLVLVSTGPHFTDLFGATNLPSGIAELHSGAFGGDSSILALAVFLTVVAACLGIAGFVVRGIAAQGTEIDWTAHEARCLLVGALLIVGCFFAGQSIGYRGIHLLFVLSGLMALRRSIRDRALGRLLLCTIGAILLLMWEEGIRHSFEFLLRAIGSDDKVPGIPSEIFWLVRELTWWWVVGVLSAMVALFALQSPSSRAVATAWSSRRPLSG